ncbi:hypothetical protein B484DRAFT_452726 [Ochromonadaceae sp. CCMP2298]|nr:hypothetical protein B484DRAFT_452726 [Ochromonadaceae sp. CCMP2298]
MWAMILALIVSGLLLVEGGSRVHPDADMDSRCEAVRETSQKLNTAQRTITFRCRTGDDCGGVGDRLGGVMGGAFYALLSGRSYRVHWPGLEQIFEPRHTNWTFDPAHLNIQYLDAQGEELSHRLVETENGEGVLGSLRPYLPYDNSSSDKSVGVVNDLNALPPRINDPTQYAELEAYTHLLLHSNRGPTKAMYQKVNAKYGWKAGDDDESYMQAFRCVFHELFKATDSFLRSPYTAVGHPSVRFEEVLGRVADPSTLSAAVHYRVDDDIASNDSPTADPRAALDRQTLTRILKLGDELTRMGKGDRAVLYFVTNGNASAAAVLQNAEVRARFSSVYVQELYGAKHVNQHHKGATLSPAEIVTLQQAWRDWVLMYKCDVLMYDNSGFSKSATLLAPREQLRYEGYGYTAKDQPYQMCGNRFC